MGGKFRMRWQFENDVIFYEVKVDVLIFNPEIDPGYSTSNLPHICLSTFSSNFRHKLQQ